MGGTFKGDIGLYRGYVGSYALWGLGPPQPLPSPSCVVRRDPYKVPSIDIWEFPSITVQIGGNLYRAPYYNRNLNIGPRTDSNLGQSPYGSYIYHLGLEYYNPYYRDPQNAAPMLWKP